MPTKTYNDSSSHVQDWTTKKLKKTYLSLYSSVYQLECFGTHDLLKMEACAAELVTRGYEIKNGTPIISLATHP